ncbi:mitogen-activated protein kinase kinase kinase 17-like [Rutidosis leptorrhynchoides]|uniref:mitogen-activated protein kinase kinase kinase 17-like n=1 Tax=Rutidosis leptorrhynchoides TaxID=125765 RepID=UPI003A996D2D
MEWARGDVLGRGSSATVTAATSTSGEIFSVKSVDFSQSENLKKEQHILSMLNSPYVVSYKGYDTTRENNNIVYNIFMDYMSSGSIIDLINSRKGVGLTNMEIARYASNIVKGLDYIHSSGIVHCDIKGRNILVHENGAKIGDFGCAKWANQVSLISGTPMFMAPEVARGEEQGYAADIWAFGCTLIEMITGNSPWSNVTDPCSVLYRIAYSNEIPDIPSVISDQVKDFIIKCLIRDPRNRWTAKELLKHPFIQQFDENSNEIVCEKIGTNSPTSILDQDVWDSIEESSSLSSLSSSLSLVMDDKFGQSTCFSVRQRIEQLACKSETEKWVSEKGWITVRGCGAVIDRCGR